VKRGSARRTAPKTIDLCPGTFHQLACLTMPRARAHCSPPVADRHTMWVALVRPDDDRTPCFLARSMPDIPLRLLGERPDRSPAAARRSHYSAHYRRTKSLHNGFGQQAPFRVVLDVMRIMRRRGCVVAEQVGQHQMCRDSGPPRPSCRRPGRSPWRKACRRSGLYTYFAQTAASAPRPCRLPPLFSCFSRRRFPVTAPVQRPSRAAQVRV